MRITITCDSEYEARCAMRAKCMLEVLRDLDEAMRQTVKFDASPCIPEDDDGACLYNHTVILTTQYWRDRLHDACATYGIDLDDDEVPA
jgi:hypothetical protein